ncbi:unnamed protein product [Polarella glacialis]|uniref:Sm protein F n=1 Tax=Polarella glacialis TaxID=89957 RepID=A0A813D414_POLGL|nr:unnamed protein product [Polarella glacialis]
MTAVAVFDVRECEQESTLPPSPELVALFDDMSGLAVLKGRLHEPIRSIDPYMNLQLLNTEEWVDGSFRGNLGEVFIRCNNVLYIRGMADEESDMD